MLSSLQRLFLVGCWCVQFPRQFCSIPERLIPSFPSLSLSSLISKRRCCLLLWPALPRALSSVIRVPDVQIYIQGLVFSAYLILLPCSDIDVILGMDWLVQHKANIYCPTRSVRLTHESGAAVLYTCGSVAGAAQFYALHAGVTPLLEEV